MEQFCVYLPENYIYSDSTFPPPLWSECTAQSFRTLNACELFHDHFNVLLYYCTILLLFYSYIAHHNIFVLVSALQKIRNESRIKMRSVTTRRFKKSATFKKEELPPQKLDNKELTWFQESNLSHQCHTNFYQVNTCSSLFFAFTMPLATSVTVHVTAQKITDTTYVKTQWAKRFEVGRYTFQK